MISTFLLKINIFCFFYMPSFKNLLKNHCKRTDVSKLTVLQNPMGFLKVFGYRGISRKPQEAQDGSQKTPKKSKTPKNRNPKLRPKIIKKIGTNFWTNSKTQAQQKKTKMDPILGTPFPRISGIQIMPRQKVNERGEKTIMTGIILYKRKGGIRPL